MKKWLITLAAFTLVSCGIAFTHLPGIPGLVLEAQTLPYTLTVSWNASADAATYTCYLDGVAQVTGVSALTCSFPVAALGAHTVGVTAVNTSFVPSESLPATLAFTLKQPSPAAQVKVK